METFASRNATNTINATGTVTFGDIKNHCEIYKPKIIALKNKNTSDEEIISCLNLDKHINTLLKKYNTQLIGYEKDIAKKIILEFSNLSFSSRFTTSSLSDFNYENLINNIRSSMLLKQKNIRESISEKVEDYSQQDYENLLKNELKQEVKKYIQSNLPKYINSIQEITNTVYQNMYGLGLIDKYKSIPSVTDVIVFGKKLMYIQNGIRILAPENFSTMEDVKIIYKKIASNANINISADEPRKDCELPDGSRVLMIIPPESVEPYIVIRKHTQVNTSIDNLELDGLEQQIGTIVKCKKIKTNENIAEDQLVKVPCDSSVREYAKQAIKQRKNIVFVGSTGSGKTTFMNSLTHYIQKNHIVAVLEDTRELSLPLPFVYYLKTRKAESGAKEITYQDILMDCLRANPDRIMLTEIRSPESAYTLIHVLNSGHKGSMTTIHSNSALDSLDKLENLIGEHKKMDITVIRQIISKAIDIIIFLSLQEDANGNKIGRAIKEIVEIHGVKEDFNYDYKYIYKNI